jgi:BRCT domain type II-containing protein
MSSTPTLESLNQELTRLPPLEPCDDVNSTSSEFPKPQSPSRSSSTSSRSSVACDTDNEALTSTSHPPRASSGDVKSNSNSKPTRRRRKGDKSHNKHGDNKRTVVNSNSNTTQASPDTHSKATQQGVKGKGTPTRVLSVLEPEIDIDDGGGVQIGAHGAMQPPVSLQVLEDEGSVAAEADRMPGHWVVFDPVLGVVSKQVRDQLGRSPAGGPARCSTANATAGAVMPQTLVLD